MAHGKRAQRRGKRMQDFEYWQSRLHPGGELPGRITKTLTHKKERRESKEVAREAAKEVDGG